jgi:hypothetical protein
MIKNMKIKLIGLLLIIAVATQAQVSYSVSPFRTVAFTALFDQLNGSTIYQINTGPQKILLKWERLSVDVPNGWTASICDNIFCFGDIPVGSTMDSVAPAEKGFLILDIDPGTVKGSGVVKVYVYQDGYYHMGDTLTWNVTSSAVGVDDLLVTNAIVVYPNPVKDHLQIDLQNSGIKTDSGYILDALGREVIRFPLLQQNNTIDVSGLKDGCYNVVIGTRAIQLIIDN